MKISVRGNYAIILIFTDQEKFWIIRCMKPEHFCKSVTRLKCKVLRGFSDLVCFRESTRLQRVPWSPGFAETRSRPWTEKEVPRHGELDLISYISNWKYPLSSVLTTEWWKYVYGRKMADIPAILILFFFFGFVDSLYSNASSFKLAPLVVSQMRTVVRELLVAFWIGYRNGVYWWPDPFSFVRTPRYSNDEIALVRVSDVGWMIPIVWWAPLHSFTQSSVHGRALKNFFSCPFFVPVVWKSSAGHPGHRSVSVEGRGWNSHTTFWLRQIVTRFWLGCDGSHLSMWVRSD
jgi:hypothetical protein